MSLNWIDWIVIAFLGYEAYGGWHSGFLALGTSFISLAVGLLLAVKLNAPVAAFFAEKFGIAGNWATVFGYIVVTLIADMLVSELLRKLIARAPKKILESKLNSAVGSIVSTLNGALIVAFILLVVSSLPLRGTIKSDIRASKIGGAIIKAVEKVGGPIKATFEQAQQQAAKFFTISPGSKESITLDVAPKSADLRIDESAERKMLEFVNAERRKASLSPVGIDVKIVAVARAHSRDMFERRYFSHLTPEGKDPGDRLRMGGVSYVLAGENLAYAPDVTTAHQGLMDSPEHKKNILDPDFHRIGIGIISADNYGMMVTQNFAN